MTDAEMLDLAVRRTGHRRYRDFLDSEHPDYDPTFWPLVRAAATGIPPEPPKLPPIPDNPTPAPGVRLGGCCGG